MSWMIDTVLRKYYNYTYCDWSDWDIKDHMIAVRGHKWVLINGKRVDKGRLYNCSACGLWFAIWSKAHSSNTYGKTCEEQIMKKVLG